MRLRVLQEKRDWVAIDPQIFFPSDHDSMSSHLGDSRRSVRAPLKLTITVGGNASKLVLGETIIVNVHGALIRTSIPLAKNAKISIHVYLTDKRAAATVVHIDPENSLQCGIELEQPRNIWGMLLPPDNWHQPTGSELVQAEHEQHKKTRNKPHRCPYCAVDDEFLLMKTLSSGGLICESCGHIVFVDDLSFRCPCRKCTEIGFSARVRNSQRGS